MKKSQKIKRPAIRLFCGVQPLKKRISLLTKFTAEPLSYREATVIVEELELLDAVLKRLRYERGFLDELDIDQAIDRLRRGPEGGA
nr:hypothetical protein [uncultured Desulfobulbus sp.]